MAAPLDPTLPKLAIGANVGKAPDGSWWVTVGVMLGTATFQFGIPLDGADEAADGLAAMIKEAAKDGRRQRTGLVVVQGGAGETVVPNRADRRRR